MISRGCNYEEKEKGVIVAAAVGAASVAFLRSIAILRCRRCEGPGLLPSTNALLLLSKAVAAKICMSQEGSIDMIECTLISFAHF